MYTHGTTSPFPSTSDRLLAVTIDDTSHLAATLVQEVPADSGNFPWYMTDSIAVLEDSYSEVVVNVIDLALNWQLFSDVVPMCFCNWERVSSPRSMLRYVILLTIHKGIGYKFGVACCCTLTSTTDFRFLGKVPSQLFYSSFQGIQYTFTSVPMHQNS